jgi:hypothetical protein
MTLNGQPALVFVEGAEVVAALVLDFRAEKVVGVRVVSNPDKLEWCRAHLGRTA